jgi:hypothetical protein
MTTPEADSPPTLEAAKYEIDGVLTYCGHIGEYDRARLRKASDILEALAKKEPTGEANSGYIARIPNRLSWEQEALKRLRATVKDEIQAWSLKPDSLQEKPHMIGLLAWFLAEIGKAEAQTK